MDMTLSALFGLIMRWLHIVSVITVTGGFLYARFMVAPALTALSPADAASVSNRIVARFRPVLFTAMGVLLLSGLYNYLTKASYPPHYHAVIGVKFLFVLHVFATAVLYTMPDAGDAKRLRRLTSLVISSALIVLISGELRWMTLAAAK